MYAGGKGKKEDIAACARGVMDGGLSQSLHSLDMQTACTARRSCSQGDINSSLSPSDIIIGYVTT